MNEARLWLKDLREKQNMTHNDVATNSGIERAYYTMIEKGNRNPSVQTAKQIASTLNFEWTIFFENKCNEVKQV